MIPSRSTDENANRVLVTSSSCPGGTSMNLLLVVTCTTAPFRGSMKMAPTGHLATHTPHMIQPSDLTFGRPPAPSGDTTSVGQTCSILSTGNPSKGKCENSFSPYR